jgi:DNA gyrase subunit A
MDIKKTVLELKHLKVILLSPYYIFKKIKLDFIKIKLKYPKVRKTIIKTFQTTKNHYSKKLYTKKEFLFIVTESRLMYKFNVDFYKIQHKGGKGKNLFSYLLKSSNVNFSFLSSVNNYIFIFTSNGRVYRLSIINILRNIENKKQTLLNSFANLDLNERIVDCINIRSSMDVSNVNYLIICTINGQVKKTLFKSYLNVSKRGLIAISLKSGDHVSKSKLVSANSNIIISTEKGYCIKFNVNSLCEKERKSVGFKSISLSLHDKVNSLNAIPFNNNMFLLHITSLGYGKKTSVNAYKVQKKNGKGVISLKLSSNLDKSVSVLLIDEEECMFVITNVGRILKILLKCLKLQTRYSKGIKVISLGKNEFIVSCLLIN